MPATRITGKEYPVKDILCNKFIMRIPNYQRPYAWGIEQVQTLLEDLLNALGNLDDSSDDRDAYFLGSVVLVKDENDPKADVVDGQQRLTTLTILLAVIRSLMIDPDYKNELTQMIFLRGNRLRNEKDSYYLTLRERDAEFFQDHIQKDLDLIKLQTVNIAALANQSQINIVQNARLLFGMLKGYSQTNLEAIATYIINQCYLIIVTTPSTEAAYRIFSVLNDRGLDLAFTDICKAELIGLIGKLDASFEDAYTKKWEDAEEQITRDGFKDLFGHIRTVFLKTRLRDTILKELRLFVFPQFKNPTGFIDEGLIPYTNAYDAIKTFSYQSDTKADEVNAMLRWLRWIDNSDWLPVAMLAHYKYREDSATLLSILTNLERLAASMTVRRENVNTRQTRYNEVLAWIDQNKDFNALESPLNLKQAEMTETINRLKGDVYNSGARGYIMRRLNGLMSEDKSTPDTAIFTVEHVLPQNPPLNSQWLEWYPDQDRRAFITHTLGNLALLSKRKNSSASNFDFQTKKLRYFAHPVTPFALTTSIVNEASWTQGVYDRRQTDYLNLLKSAWRLQG